MKIEGVALLSGSGEKIRGSRRCLAVVEIALALEFVARGQRIFTYRRPVEMNISGVDGSIKKARRCALKPCTERAVVIRSLGCQSLIITADEELTVDDLIDNQLPVEES